MAITGEPSDGRIRAVDLDRGTNQAGVRLYNERLVLSLIRREGALPKADLAGSRAFRHRPCPSSSKQLEADGLVRKEEPQRGRVGQPKVPFSLSADGGARLRPQDRPAQRRSRPDRFRRQGAAPGAHHLPLSRALEPSRLRRGQRRGLHRGSHGRRASPHRRARHRLALSALELAYEVGARRGRSTSGRPPTSAPRSRPSSPGRSSSATTPPPPAPPNSSSAPTAASGTGSISSSALRRRRRRAERRALSRPVRQRRRGRLDADFRRSTEFSS